jgi:hypothetical protein
MWANSHEAEGETRVFYTINLERNHKDKNDE